jgi:primase-polymerase (primpol)-like protein
MTSRSCEACSGPISGYARASARFCSSACRQRAYRGRVRAGVPAELRERDRWVRWSPKKVPLQVDGRVASSTDPATWASYARVRGSKRKGFVLGEGIACLDLDKCIDDGVLVPWARKVLRQVSGTYVEVSPSGAGLHVWGRGRIEPGRRVRFAGGVVEAYSSGRYITVTGQPWQGAPSVLGDLQPFLDRLAAL